MAHQLAWPVPYLGLGLIMFGMGSLPTITISYGTPLGPNSGPNSDE